MTLFIVYVPFQWLNQAVEQRLSNTEGRYDMNKRFLVLIITGAIFTTAFAAGCAAQKRNKPASIDPVAISTSATQTAATTTRPSMVETKVVTVYREATRPSETETEATTTTTTAKPTATPKPTAKPTAKPTKKPTAKPTKKPTKKPTAKPAAKTTLKNTATNNVTVGKLSSNNESVTGLSKVSGNYYSSYSEMTIDATVFTRIKITVTIHDQEDTSKATVWKMTGSYQPATSTIECYSCTKQNVQYDKNNEIVTKTTVYDNGKAELKVKSGMIIWNDYQEHIADDMTFISPKGHDHGSAT